MEWLSFEIPHVITRSYYSSCADCVVRELKILTSLDTHTHNTHTDYWLTWWCEIFCNPSGILSLRLTVCHDWQERTLCLESRDYYNTNSHYIPSDRGALWDEISVVNCIFSPYLHQVVHACLHLLCYSTHASQAGTSQAPALVPSRTRWPLWPSHTVDRIVMPLKHENECHSVCYLVHGTILHMLMSSSC